MSEVPGISALPTGNHFPPPVHTWFRGRPAPLGSENPLLVALPSSAHLQSSMVWSHATSHPQPQSCPAKPAPRILFHLERHQCQKPLGFSAVFYLPSNSQHRGSCFPTSVPLLGLGCFVLTLKDATHPFQAPLPKATSSRKPSPHPLA